MSAFGERGLGPRALTTLILTILLVSCADPPIVDHPVMNRVAERYVKLVLRIGVWDPGYVDAYYGPDEWRPDTTRYNPDHEFPDARLRAEADSLLATLSAVDGSRLGKLNRLRLASLEKQLVSVRAIIDLMSGVKMTFDEESRFLYDAVAPPLDTAQLEIVLSELDSLLPGEGELGGRMKAFNELYEIPEDKLAAIVDTAIAESRNRTLAHIMLPAGEAFTTEYVTDKPWGAYNWYRGNNQSLIQMNTDFPKRIASPIGTGAHEAYPGHHVYQVLLEQKLVNERGWVEFAIFPIYSPQGFIAEGTANYGTRVAFPGQEREQFERDVLFPMAGIDSSLADIFYEVRELSRKRRFASIHAAREYLDGRWTKEETIDWLMKYTLSTRPEAGQSIKFYDTYRSYVINYGLGEQTVATYMEENGGTEENPERRWELFEELISTPQIPSGIR